MKKIFNKRVIKNTLAFGLITFLINSSCTTDLLDQSNNNGTSTSNFGASPSQVEKAINGAYHSLTTYAVFGRELHGGPCLRSDEYKPEPFQTNKNMAGLLGQPGDRWALDIWQQLYASIGRSNRVINTDLTAGIPDETTRNNLQGQAFFLRALAYWYLTNLYGSVPLSVAEPDLSNVQISKNTVSEIYDQIISDLETAETMLPESWTGSNLGRPTSGAATALLGKTFLYQKKWAEAATALKRVIDSGLYALLPASQYGDNFTQVNENNQESVFEMQFAPVAVFLWGIDQSGVGTQGHYLIEYLPPTLTPDTPNAINPWIRDLFEKPRNAADFLRKSETIVYDYPGAQGFVGADFLSDFADDIAANEAAGMAPIFQKKYAGFDLGDRSSIPSVNAGHTQGANLRIIRYSNVLLMYAEALNEQGSPGEAVEYVNMVRGRAGLGIDLLDTSISQTDLFDAIVEERAMELFGEGHRFFDLVRWGLADKYLGPNSEHISTAGFHPKSQAGGAFQTNKDEILWIPPGEIATNPNLLPQNPGYN